MNIKEKVMVGRMKATLEGAIASLDGKNDDWLVNKNHDPVYYRIGAAKQSITTALKCIDKIKEYQHDT